jgi:hypothetical protein
MHLGKNRLKKELAGKRVFHNLYPPYGKDFMA